MMRSEDLLAAALVVVALGLAASCEGQAPDFVAVVHRHGARMPVLPVNTSIVCPGLPCGALLPEGKEMLKSLGRYMAAQYPQQFPSSPSYNPDTVAVRSTSLQRTLQSADSFLWGAFPSVGAYYPVIETVPIATDVLLDPYGAWPTSVVHSTNPEVYAAQTQATEEYAASVGIDNAALLAFAAESHQYLLCPAYPYYCVLGAQDLAESLRARGLLNASSYPALTAFHERLDAVAEYYNRLKFVYNASDPQWRGTGSFGQLLAAAIVQEAQQFASGALSYPFKEYSAHDTTLMPLYVSLDILDEMRPKFAEAIVFEFYGTGDPSNMTVSAMRGYPQQTPGPHNYTFTPLLLSCMSAAGNVSKSVSCRLPDFQRALARFDPAPMDGGAGGQCYFNAVDQAASCPGDASEPPTNAVCIQYRQSCPAQACGPSALLNATSLACVSLTAPHPPVAGRRSPLW